LTYFLKISKFNRKVKKL